jgi:hypothetical protein
MRVRASVGRGNRGGSDNRLRRACSFIDDSAAEGCGEGSCSSVNLARRPFFSAGSSPSGVEAGSGGRISSSASLGMAAVLWKRACLLWLGGVTCRGAVLAAA